MLQKIKNFPTSDLYKALGDIRNIGLIAFGFIAVLVTWSGVKVVQSNYELQKQISVMEQQHTIQQLANNNLRLKNQYLETDQYLELTARRHYNKAAPGEKLLIVPKSVALARTIDIPKLIDDTSLITNEPDGVWYERNFNAWLEFLFRRPAN